MKEPQPRVQWQSVQWPDSSSYEGLVKDDKCHVRGVFRYCNGDRYEGEFEENNMSGYGVYVWGQEGSVYRGQWSASMMSGCGVKITRQPNGSYLAEEGRFVNDEWVGDVMGCSIEQARAAAANADTAAQLARVFEQLDSGGAISDAAIKAQETAANAASLAQQAKSRRRQQQQQHKAVDGSGVAADAAPASPAAASSNRQGRAGVRPEVLLRQAQLSAQQTGQTAQRLGRQAWQGVQQALKQGQAALQQAVKAGQQKLQKQQESRASS